MIFIVSKLRTKVPEVLTGLVIDAHPSYTPVSLYHYLFDLLPG